MSDCRKPDILSDIDHNPLKQGDYLALRELFIHHPTPTALCDQSGMFIATNLAFNKLLGTVAPGFEQQFNQSFPSANWTGVAGGIQLRLERNGTNWLLTLDSAEILNLRQRLLDATQARGKFLSAANHDLRQPLQAMLMYSTVLETRAEDEATKNIALRMQDSAQAIDSLLTSLVFAAKLDAEIIPVYINQFALSGPLGRAVAAVTEEAEEKGIKLHLMPTKLQTETDPELLEKLLLELLRNAVRFTPKGKVLVGARIQHDEISLQIWDQGIGIEEAELSNVFNDFYQVDNAARDRRRGLGLGLGIVQRLCNLLSLELDISSQVGRGTLVQLSLPLKSLHRRPKPTQLPLDLASRGGHILVVDDDADILNSLQMVLEYWGHRVSVALSPDQALNLPVQPDFIICDNRMPNWSGIAAMQALEGCYGPMAALILTGDTAPETLAEITAAGYGVILKPIEAKVLRQEMERVRQSWAEKVKPKAKIRKRTCKARPLQATLL